MEIMSQYTSLREAASAAGRYRLLALDVDGTLLDAEGRLSPRTADAVARASRAGILPVLCTGRRYRRARAITEQLGLAAPIVCNSGAIVKDPSDHRTLWRADFAPNLSDEVRALFRAFGEPGVVFNDRPPAEADFRVPAFPTGRVMFDDFVEKNREHAEIDPAWSDADPDRDEPWFHVCAIGSYEEMAAFERSALERMGGRIQTFVLRTSRYLGTMCEILRVDASKWSALRHLADLWGIASEEICAVGDDSNDIPMIRHAGLGVAMGHAHQEVLAAADLVTGRHDEDGVAMLVDEVLLAP